MHQYKTYYNIQKEHLYIKVDFGLNTGFAEYKYYSSLNYPAIEQVLSDLKHFSNHFLYRNAYMDAFVFKLDGVLPWLKNHSLYYQSKLYEFSETIKVKLTGDLSNDMNLLKDCYKNYSNVRVDGNYHYAMKSFKKLLTSLNIHKIEYIEDPIKYNIEQYLELNRTFNIALDHEFNLKGSLVKGIDHYIVRPTINSNVAHIRDNYIYSNQMGSPLDSWHSFAYACHYSNLSLAHGLFNPLVEDIYLTKDAYISLDLNKVKKFKDYLSECSWKPLC
jgi:hypothetical protein